MPRPHILLRLCQPAPLKRIALSPGRQGLAQRPGEALLVNGHSDHTEVPGVAV